MAAIREHISRVLSLEPQTRCSLWRLKQLRKLSARKSDAADLLATTSSSALKQRRNIQLAARAADLWRAPLTSAGNARSERLPEIENLSHVSKVL